MSPENFDNKGNHLQLITNPNDSYATQAMLLKVRDELKSDISSLDLKMAARCNTIDARFDDVDVKFKGVDTRFDEVDARFKGVDARFDEVDARFNEVDARFDEVDARFKGVDTRFNNLETKMDAKFINLENKMDTKFISLETKMDAKFSKLESKMDSMLLAIASQIEKVMAKVHEMAIGVEVQRAENRTVWDQQNHIWGEHKKLEERVEVLEGQAIFIKK